MSSNFFFQKKNIKISKAFIHTNFKKDFLINDVRPLHLARERDLTFFDSSKYKNDATKIGNENFENLSENLCLSPILSPPPL